MNPILVSISGQVTTVSLNRPEKRNALNVALLKGLTEAVHAAESDPHQRVLVVRGEGAAFCAGLDLTEASNPEMAETSAGLIAESLKALSSSRLVTIASVHGAAIAGGAGLMSACDFAIAAQGTKIGYPEVRRGLVAAQVMTFLRRQLHERDARYLLLTGELVDAARAQAMGLVTWVAPEKDLAKEVQHVCHSVLHGAPEAVAHTKALFAELWHHPAEADIDRALALHMIARGSAEAKEGIAAFHEKRKPRWSP